MKSTNAELKSWWRDLAGASAELARCRTPQASSRTRSGGGAYDSEFLIYAAAGVIGGIREEEEGDRGKQPLTGSDATSRAMRSATSTACREPAHATFIASTSKRAAALSAARWSPSAAAWSMAISAPARIRALAEFRVRRSPNCSSLSPRSIWKSGGRINRDGEAGEARIAMRKTKRSGGLYCCSVFCWSLFQFHTQFFSI